MAEAPTITQGMYCHIEIPSNDPTKAKGFYGDLFGWQFTDMPMGEGTYSLYMTAEGGIGGGIWNPPDGMPRQIINYIAVDEIEPVVEKAEAGGGKVVMPTVELPGIGWFSLIADPDGNVFGIWKDNPNKG
jgi:predicted enzyme related to lactoylglutathione lyase